MRFICKTMETSDELLRGSPEHDSNKSSRSPLLRKCNSIVQKEREKCWLMVVVEAPKESYWAHTHTHLPPLLTVPPAAAAAIQFHGYGCGTQVDFKANVTKEPVWFVVVVVFFPAARANALEWNAPCSCYMMSWKIAAPRLLTGSWVIQVVGGVWGVMSSFCEAVLGNLLLCQFASARFLMLWL